MLIILLLISDAVLIDISFILGHYLKHGFSLSPYALIEQNSRLLVFATLTLIAVFNAFSLYAKNNRKSEVDEIGKIIGALTAGMLFFEFMTIFYRDLIFKRLIIFWAWFISCILIGLVRVGSIMVQKKLYKIGFGASNILIVGSGELSQTIQKKILDNPQMGMRIKGIISNRLDEIGREINGIKIMGGINDIKRIIRTQNISKIIFAIPEADSSVMMKVIEDCELEKVKFLFTPKILDIVASRINTDEISGFPLIAVNEIQLYGINAFVKRASDLILGCLILIFLLPLFLFISILIKIDSKGPVLFWQHRVGKNEKIFKMHKFRSMFLGAQDSVYSLIDKNEADGLIFKIKNDPRITRVGKILRRLSLDELPQIINVLKGEMSLVGPRPPLPGEVEKYSEWHRKRLRILPGITGLWQVSGRSELPFEDMVKLDVLYIENWSLWLDLKILLKTIPVVLTAKGAY